MSVTGIRHLNDRAFLRLAEVAYVPGPLEGFGVDQGSCNVSGVFIDVARDLAVWFFRAALRFERTGVTVQLAGAIEQRLAVVHCAACSELLSAGALVNVFRCVVAEVGAWPEQSLRERKRVEMRFAHMKRILRLDRLRLRGLSGTRDEVLVQFLNEWDGSVSQNGVYGTARVWAIFLGNPTRLAKSAAIDVDVSAARRSFS